MPVWLAFGAVLRWNYTRSERGKSTFCSFGRAHLTPAQFLFLLACGLAWFVPHFLNPMLEKPLRAPEFLMTMPARVLFGTARGIESWCAENGKCRPTLLDLARARDARKGERARRRR
jgi:hypothetical protein